MSAVRPSAGIVPPPPPDAPSARELIAESALITPFRLHSMPMTRTDTATCRALAAKLSEAEVHWIMLIMLEFFRHGQRDFLRSHGVRPLFEPVREQSDSAAREEGGAAHHRHRTLKG
jgi:hypothetical protein